MVQLDNDQISVPTWLEGLENTKYRKTQNFLKNHEIFAKIISSISGAVSIERPRMVSDTMEQGGILSGSAAAPLTEIFTN